MEMETAHFLKDRTDRIRQIRERHERELEQFDEESARLGFRFDILKYFTIFLNYYLFYNGFILVPLQLLKHQVWKKIVCLAVCLV